MTESKRRHGLRGTVLIMVLTVMAMLIVILMTTLSVVTAANQRIYTKYEENQAYYSARSALDVFAQNMLADKKYITYEGAAGNEVYYKHSNNVVSTDKMKQGLALQLDLYSINAQNGGDVKQAALTAYANKTGIHGTENAKDEYLYYFGTEPTPGTTIDSITYVVAMPAVSGTPGSYGKLSDYKGYKDTAGTAYENPYATIKVEVLSRIYDIGSYTDGAVVKNVPDDDREAFFKREGSYSSVTDAMIAEAVFNGNRKKDTMKVKITATSYFQDTMGTAVLIFDTDEPPVNNSSRAITSFGSQNGTNHAYIVGGVSMLGSGITYDADGIPNETAEMRNGGGIFGSVYDEIGYDSNVASPIYLTEQEYLYIGGKFVTDNMDNAAIAAKDGSGSDLNKRPFVYIGGNFAPNNKFYGLGGTGTTPGEAVDLFVAGTFTPPGNGFGINGNLYLAKDTNINQNNFSVNGSIFVDGDLTLNDSYIIDSGIDGVTGEQIYTINFDNGGRVAHLYYGGKIIRASDGLDLTADPTVKFQNQDGTAIVKFTSGALSSKLPTQDDIKKATSGGPTEFPIDLSGLGDTSLVGVKRTIETHKTNYDDYYYVSGGAYVDAAGNPSATPVPKSAQDLAGVDFTNPSVIAGATELLMPMQGNGFFSGSSRTIDTTVDGTTYYLKSSQGSATVKIQGGGTVELFLYNSDGSGYSHSNGQLDIIVADDTTLKVYGANANKDYYFQNMRFWTQTVYDAYSVSGTELNVGSKAGNNIKVPKIYYYFDGGTINLNNGQNFFTGYFFAPKSELAANAGSNMTFSKLKYNGALVPSSWRFDFLGSLLIGDYNFQNDHGVIYINPALADDGDAGDPIHAWKTIQYART